MSNIDQIPQFIFRWAGLSDLPALPVDISEMLVTLPKLAVRLKEQQPAKEGLSNEYTIAGQTETGGTFLYGKSVRDRLEEGVEELLSAVRDSPSGVLTRIYRLLQDSDPDGESREEEPELTALSLESPEQWTISWTNYDDIYQEAQPLLKNWAATMTDVDVAEAEFWSNMAVYGIGYNLLVLQKVVEGTGGTLRSKLGEAWTDEHEDLLEAGRLYAIDMSIFEKVSVNEVSGRERFTPASITLLKQDPESKKLVPILIRVAGKGGKGAQIFTRASATESAWLYAMLAAKTSVTVYGIWLGHVYHWHIVTAAMQMTMYNELPEDHPVYLALAPQSKHLFGFDDILLLIWEDLAPPTSISTAYQFLELINEFAKNRPFGADNPRQALADLGLDPADFTVDAPWDQYPIVGYFLEVWDAAESYARKVVNASYESDREVRRDRELRKWLSESGDSSEGNIQGLPDVDTREELTDILASLVYRITVHGVARLTNTANPAMTFVPNFPPCLQDSLIPEPGEEIDTKTLLGYLPNTGTIGVMMNFYFIFAFSAPYESFLPKEGMETNLFYPGGPEEPRNAALIEFRKKIAAFMEKYQSGEPQLQQWPMNIET